MQSYEGAAREEWPGKPSEGMEENVVNHVSYQIAEALGDGQPTSHPGATCWDGSFTKAAIEAKACSFAKLDEVPMLVTAVSGALLRVLAQCLTKWNECVTHNYSRMLQNLSLATQHILALIQTQLSEFDCRIPTLEAHT